MGGDFYDFLSLDDDRVGIVIGDVSGKGIAAALVMANTQSVLLAPLGEGKHRPRAGVGRGQRGPVCIHPGRHVRHLFLWHPRPESGRLVYANAGHDPPICSGMVMHRSSWRGACRSA